MQGITALIPDPYQAIYYIYDATISYPNIGTSVPSWVAVVAPLALLAISVIVGERIGDADYSCQP